MQKRLLIASLCNLISCCVLAATGINLDTSRMNTDHFVLSFDAGLGLLGTEYQAGASYGWSSNIVGIRYLRTDQLTFELALAGTPNPGYPRPIESIWSIDAYIGKKYISRDIAISLTAGIGILGGIQRGKIIGQEEGSSYTQYERLVSTTYEVPFEGRLSYVPWDYAECGISYLYSFNPKKDYKSIFFSFKFLLPL